MKQFIAATGLSNPHLQTLAPRLIRKKALFEPFWQTLDTPDGDFLDIAWSEDQNTPTSNRKPIFILFHGLEGCFYSPYANGLMKAFSDQGWLSVMMHFRGCSGKPNKLARAYHSGEINDARFFLEYLDQHYPNRIKVAVGISLGGNMLMKLAGETQTHNPLSACVSVSAPLRLDECAKAIADGFSKV